jgi:arylsulfatase A
MTHIQKLAGTALAIGWLGAVAGVAGTTPNVVLVFMDDMGYADVGCFGARGYETPNIDKLAAEGRRFTNFHVAQAVCSASRCALLTGCYPNRVGIFGALGPGSKNGIGAGELTLAEVFKQKGYATACFGKWHLGHHPQFLPPNHGFDEYFGIPYSNDMWPHHPEAKPGAYPDLPLIEGTEVVHSPVTPEDQKMFTRRFTERSVDFIRRNSKQPFFLYLPHPMVHVPLFASPEFEGKSGKGLFADVMMEVDWSVGELMRALEETGVADRTLFIFTSDNGPWLSYGDHAGSTGGLREGKGTSWEGGKRVPCVMRWPGVIPAGTSSDAMLMTIDLLPTLAARIGAELPDHPIDGRDVLPLLTGPEDTPNPHPYYAFYYAQNELQALVSGDGRWKLVLPHQFRTLAGRPGGTGGKPVKYEQTKVLEAQLFDLKADVGESTDVAASHPEVVARMQGWAAEMRSDLGDRLTGVPATGSRPPGRLPEDAQDTVP